MKLILAPEKSSRMSACAKFLMMAERKMVTGLESLQNMGMWVGSFGSGFIEKKRKNRMLKCGHADETKITLSAQ